MLNRLVMRPGQFSHLYQEYDWYEFVTTRRIAYLAVKKETPIQMAIHVELTVPLTRGVLRELKEGWKEVIDMAHFFGVRYIVAMGDPLNKKWPKFLKHFGFGEPQVVAVACQEV